MDLATQEKISKLMREQSEKLSIVLGALRKIKRLTKDNTVKDAVAIAEQATTEIARYGKTPQDL